MSERQWQTKILAKAAAEKEALQLIREDLKKYADMDVEELLSQLTEAELDELNDDCDPDNSSLPPHLRCRDHTKKSPTGPLNRQKLLKYLEAKAKEEADWEDKLPYESGTKRGKVFIPKPVQKEQISEEDGIELDLPEEYVNALNTASEPELIDFAGVLGLHSMLTQDQYWESFKEVLAQDQDASFMGPAKGTPLKILPLEPPNNTDLDDAMNKLKNNDKSLTRLNLNNMKSLSEDQMIELSDALKSNTTLEELSMTYVRATDKVAVHLCDMLEENTTLKVLNVDSNLFTAEKVRDIVKAVSKSKTILELRATNQRSTVLGVRFETEICKLIEENPNILRLGLNFETLDARMKIVEFLQRNNDTLRQNRINSENYSPPKFVAPRGRREGFGKTENSE